MKYDETFLFRYSKEIIVNNDLPFKLQKRQLLKKLNFPLDQNVIIKFRELSKFRINFDFFQKDLPFLIGVHSKPMYSYITPFFIVNTREDIEYYDHCGCKKYLNSPDEIIEEICSNFIETTWIEFVKSIWNATTIAGRLIYCSFLQQILEIQKGVSSKEVGNNREIYFSTELLRFRFNQAYNILNVREYIDRSGFQRKEIDKILNALRIYQSGFESLKKISSLPTLEFGYTEEGRLIVIDVDWPEQYSRKIF